jgi:hypothetical protein
MAVGSIANHAGAIGRGTFGNQEVSAGIGFSEAENKGQGQDCCEYFFHIVDDFVVCCIEKSAQR